jgi:hypothetical protein
MNSFHWIFISEPIRQLFSANLRTAENRNMIEFVVTVLIILSSKLIGDILPFMKILLQIEDTV